MSVEVTICCDGCSIVGDGAKTAEKARQDLRDRGWKTGMPGGKDFCP